MLVEIFENVMSLSISLSVVMILLLCLAPYLEKKYLFKWWRYVWLALAFRLIFFAGVSEPIISREATTLELNLQPAALIQTLDVADPMTSNGMNSAWQNALIGLEKRSIMEMIALVWAAGVSFRLIFNFAGYYVFRNKIKQSKVNVISENIYRLLDQIKKEYDIHQDISLVYLDMNISPMLTGFFSPIILLPRETYSERELEFIFRHELMHLKHRDIWYKLVLFVSESIHWFNPIIRFAFRKANSDLELECDDRVVENRDENYKKAYSNSLLEIMNHSLKAGELKAGLLFTTNYDGGKKTMKKRFRNILDGKVKKSGTVLLIVTFLVIIFSGGLTACTVNEVNEVDPEENIASESEAGHLNTAESVLFQETTWNFAKAYFSADQDAIKKYLAEGLEPEVYERNVFNELSRLVLKWNPEALETSKMMEVQYEFMLEEEDSVTYLGMVLEYEDDQWVIQSYYLEK